MRHYLFVCLFYAGKQKKDVCFAQSLSHFNEICHIYQLTSNSIESISYQGTAISDICLQENGAAAEWNCANTISEVGENDIDVPIVSNEKALRNIDSIAPNVREDDIVLDNHVDVGESYSNDTNISQNPNIVSDIYGDTGNSCDQSEEIETFDVRRSRREKSKTIRDEHIESRMKPKTACSICGALFSYRNTLQRHIDRKHVIKHNMECAFCHQKFKHRINLKQHIKRQHIIYKKKTEKAETKTKKFLQYMQKEIH